MKRCGCIRFKEPWSSFSGSRLTVQNTAIPLVVYAALSRQMFLFSSDFLEEELLANLEDTYLPVRSVTPSKQSSGAVASPSARSFGSVKSSASRSATPNSDQQRLEKLFKASSVGVIPQPAGSICGGDTVSTSEVSGSGEFLQVDSSLGRVMRKTTGSRLFAARRACLRAYCGLFIRHTFPSERWSLDLAKELFTTGACPGVCSAKRVREFELTSSPDGILVHRRIYPPPPLASPTPWSKEAVWESPKHTP